MKKDKALAIVNELTKEFDVEVLNKKVLFMDKVEKGFEQLERGNTISHEELKNKIKGWQK
jgi:hypothetical protein